MFQLASVYMCVAERGNWGVWVHNGQGMVMCVCHQRCYHEEVLAHVLWHKEDMLVSVLYTDIPLSI